MFKRLNGTITAYDSLTETGITHNSILHISGLAVTYFSAENGWVDKPCFGSQVPNRYPMLLPNAEVVSSVIFSASTEQIM